MLRTPTPLQQLTPSKDPLHATSWVGREPATREFIEEFRNLYALVREVNNKLDTIAEFVGMPE